MKSVAMKPVIKYPAAIVAAILSLTAASCSHFSAQSPDAPDSSRPMIIPAPAEAAMPVTRACIDGEGLGWRALGEADFVNVNCDPDTWKWVNGEAHCTGTPVGVIRTKEVFTNFELVAQWRHLKSAGNSGIFLWVIEDSMKDMKRNSLPQGVEVQVLDLGYTEQYEKSSGKKADWFTCHGDVFPVGKVEMKPFPPVAPDGERSFPRKNLSKGINEWNHYYVRAINGEVRLWVNGEEVSGGTGIHPRSGPLALESEGSPVEFRNLRIRVLP